MSLWSLSHATIENFKAINNASVDISPGFSVITGPNGSGIPYTYAISFAFCNRFTLLSEYVSYSILSFCNLVHHTNLFCLQENLVS